MRINIFDLLDHRKDAALVQFDRGIMQPAEQTGRAANCSERISTRRQHFLCRRFFEDTARQIAQLQILIIQRNNKSIIALSLAIHAFDKLIHRKTKRGGIDIRQGDLSMSHLTCETIEIKRQGEFSILCQAIFVINYHIRALILSYDRKLCLDRSLVYPPVDCFSTIDRPKTGKDTHTMHNDNVIELKKPATFINAPITTILRRGAIKLLARVLETEIEIFHKSI